MFPYGVPSRKGVRGVSRGSESGRRWLPAPRRTCLLILAKQPSSEALRWSRCSRVKAHCALGATLWAARTRAPGGRRRAADNGCVSLARRDHNQFQSFPCWASSKARKQSWFLIGGRRRSVITGGTSQQREKKHHIEAVPLGNAKYSSDCLETLSCTEIYLSGYHFPHRPWFCPQGYSQ